ncbi:aminoglycoside 6'-N-acetyltransferase [Alkaliphilus transvaalensis]|uniref:aminoglycoside 6'-N-acetyltransferase n=1 Tax=Alkaliphilus transvaalensis TaxID=114628 RepID=UPI0009FF3EE8|nr:aminoglycoside 6'-N-acetyltransferase [Alkaliphilus transvaalensis]
MGKRVIEFAVKGLIIKNKHFLVMHKKGDDHQWELPGGRMEFGETAEMTVVREIEEETGLVVEPVKILDTWNLVREDRQITGIIYLCSLKEGKIKLSHEHDAYRWIPADRDSFEQLYDCFKSKMVKWDWNQLIHDVTIEEDLKNSISGTDGSIVEVKDENFHEWVTLCLKLWPANKGEDMEDEFRQLMKLPKNKAFLYKKDEEYIGFINLSLRSDYVEGSSSSPVGYLEGIYVEPSFRKNYIAKSLLEKGEAWARENGCTQIGSDIEYHNELSYVFHTNVGFKEANKLICFIKDL